MSTAYSFDAALSEESNGKSSKIDFELVSEAKSVSADEQLNEFAAELYLMVPKFLDVIKSLTDRNPSELPSLEMVMRSLLIGGAGRGFEKTFSHAIRYYKYADEAVRKYSKPGSHACETTRADLLNHFNRELRERAFALKVLDVEIIDVNPGDAVDPEIHQVDLSNRIETTDKLKVNLIAEAKSPGFRWLNEGGKFTTDPAEVILFAEKKRASSTTSRASREHLRKPR